MKRLSISIPNYFLGILLALAATNSFAAGLKDISDAEWALLPKYCYYTQSYKGHVQPYIARWEAAMGPTFYHMHHYCWGLLKYRRYERTIYSSQQRLAYLDEAHDDFQYVARNAEKDFVLLPEILTWVGRTEIKLHKFAEAEKSLSEARNIKPDYWPAYFHWVEHLQSTGRKADALELIRLGLQHSPTSKALLSQYRSLGGKPDEIPSPIRKEEVSPPKPVADSHQPADSTPAPATAPPGQN